MNGFLLVLLFSAMPALANFGGGADPSIAGTAACRSQGCISIYPLHVAQHVLQEPTGVVVVQCIVSQTSFLAIDDQPQISQQA